jgi:hypothetical protein
MIVREENFSSTRATLKVLSEDVSRAVFGVLTCKKSKVLAPGSFFFSPKYDIREKEWKSGSPKKLFALLY